MAYRGVWLMQGFGAELSTSGGQLMRGRAGSEQPRKNLEKCSKAVTKEAHSGGGA